MDVSRLVTMVPSNPVSLDILSIEDNTPLGQKAKDQKQQLAFRIQTVFDTYQLEELNYLLSKRNCLNRCNIFLIYMFHFVQSAGIMTTTIATGYNYIYLIWVGVGLNIFASLLNIYEKNNANIVKKISGNIEDIRKGKFVQEAPIEDASNDKSPNGKTQLLAGH